MVLRGRADLHLHTTASDGWPAPHQLVDYARATRLDVIAVTDHDTIEGALRAADYAAGFSKLHVVIGEEVSSRDGHIVALYIERRIRPGMSAAATVHAIHEQGGLAVAVHPFWRTQRRTRNGRIHGRGCGHAWSDPALDEQADDVAVTAGDFLTDDHPQPRRQTRGVVGGAQRTFDRVVIGDCDHVKSCCARVIDQLLR